MHRSSDIVTHPLPNNPVDLHADEGCQIEKEPVPYMLLCTALMFQSLLLEKNWPIRVREYLSDKPWTNLTYSVKHTAMANRID